MAVFRVERNKGYTVMSNHHLRNKELTLKAKGLLSQMLSLPDGRKKTLFCVAVNLLELQEINGSSRVMVGKKYPQPQCLC